MLAALTLGLAGMLAVLSWVGWNYFLAPQRLEPLAPLPDAVIPTVTKARPVGQSKPLVPSNRGWLRQVGLYLALTLLVAGAAVAGVMALRKHVALDPLQLSELERESHIQTALSPERLLPPPALPPSLFIDPDRPALETANRDWQLLDPAFMQLVLQLFARMEARGYSVALLEGYRSPERQDLLAASGARVTNARAYQSKHQFGLAADIAPMKEGRLVISERDPWAMRAYDVLGEEAEALGLTWGGRWGLRDYGHVEFASARTAVARK